MILRAGLVLTGSNILTALLNFLRNILIARLISVEDYGIAATFMITMSIIELLSSMSTDRMVVQARDGADPHFLAALHGLGIVRGLLKAAALFLLGWPMAWFFGHPDLAWAYQTLAVVPLLRSFLNNSMTVHQRKMDFRPAAISTLLTAVLSIAVVWPSAVWLGDYRVMLVQVVFGAAAGVVLTNLLSPEPYRIAWDWSVVNRAFGFGWPLLINGGLLFIIMQGDRLVIGNRIGPYELGLFSAALTLAMTPSLMVARISRLLFMPLLSRRQDNAAALGNVFVVVMQTMILGGAGLAAAVALIGPPVFDLAFGDRYAGGRAVLIWLGLVFGLRLIREGSTTVAMSVGRTKLPMMANFVRLVSLPLSFLAAGAGWGMNAVVMISAVAEVISLIVATLLMSRWLELSRLDRLGLPYALCAGVMVLVAWLAAIPAESPFDLRHLAVVVLLAALAAVSRELRSRFLGELPGRKGRRRG